MGKMASGHNRAKGQIVQRRIGNGQATVELPVRISRKIARLFL